MGVLMMKDAASTESKSLSLKLLSLRGECSDV